MLGVFRKILDMSMTGSIVIAVVLLARVFLRRAPKIYSYLLWSVVLFRLLCPLSISAQVSVLKPVPVQTGPGISSVSYGFQQSIRGSGPAPAASPEVSAAPAREVPERKAPAPMELVAWVWLAGAAGMALAGVVPFARLKKRLSEAVPLENNVYMADGIPTPFVLGIVRPNIYLPSGTPEQDKAFLLAHEKHHIRRLDPVWKLLGYGALCLHWFNPLVWLSFCLAGKDMEMSCDEAVLKTLGETIRADYAQALLKLTCRKKTFRAMPLAFGEGNTKGRILNLARWRRPKVWVSVLCGVLCVGLLAACALNPNQEEKPLEELTRTQGPASVGVGELYFTLPEGCAIEARETAGTSDGIAQVFTYGTETIGGVRTYTAPENLEREGLDGISLLPLSELTDERLGFYADGDWSDGVSVEFFSDVPEGQPRTTLNAHSLYLWKGLVYDLWFDELTAPEEMMDAIVDSVYLGQKLGVWAIGTLPEGYTTEPDPDGGFRITQAQAGTVGGTASYPIPEGVYDAGDSDYLWLNKVGIPDLEDPDLWIAGMFSWVGSNSCHMTVTDDSENPKIQRTHYFTVSGSTVYDLWLNDLLVDTQTQFAILDAIRCTAQEAPAEAETPADAAFARAQAVMNRVQEGNVEILTARNFQNTPEKNTTEDFCVHDEIGGLWRTQTADGQTRSALYLYGDENDRYFEGQGQTPEWKETDIPENLSEPWMGSFTFLKAYVTYQDTLNTEDGFTDLFRIDLPFADTPDAAPVYWANFDYDSDGAFVSVTLQVNPAMDNAVTITESIVTLDRQTVAAEIQKAAEAAQK